MSVGFGGFGRLTAAFSMKSMTMSATGLPDDFSIPSKPGDEFTSITTGPWFERSRSTPAKLSPMIYAARIATERSSGVIFTFSAVPPRCKFERNSPSAA